MADTFYSVALGEQTPDQVTVGASTSGEAIELRVTVGAGASTQALILAIETLKNYVAGAIAPT